MNELNYEHPDFEEWWDVNYTNWLPCNASDELKASVYPAAKASWIAAQELRNTTKKGAYHAF